ncbi:metal ABC transporter permease [Terricaulis sp.]|uniref:metal ABC transporter permease n=1 Tax=Terricaulis sp. TaxID=2768686 RepID=UPI0037837F6A
MNFANLEISILIPAFLAGMLVLATHVPLGQQVLNRGIVFIDLAIAQVAGLGVTAASFFGFDAEGWRVQVAAVGAALIGALLLTWTEKIWPEVQEALIGVLFVVAACVELLLLANNPHGGEHLKDLLVGQILWVQPQALIPVAILYVIALLAWFTVRRFIGQIGFYVLFALVVTQSVQLVGVYLVFASLIIPALAAKRFAEPLRLVVGYAVGITGYVAGLVASSLFDLPTGAVIVVALLGVMILAALAASVAPRSLRAGPAPALP